MLSFTNAARTLVRVCYLLVGRVKELMINRHEYVQSLFLGVFVLMKPRIGMNAPEVLMETNIHAPGKVGLFPIGVQGIQY